MLGAAAELGSNAAALSTAGTARAGAAWDIPFHTCVIEGSVIGSSAELVEQLVVEVLVSDLEASLAFYTALGFTVERRDGGFAALRWESRWLFLDQRSDLPPLHGPARANVRIVVADVDQVWATVQTLDLPVARPLADRDYGLRDFTVRDPDGFELRFAALLGVPHALPYLNES